MNTFLIHTTMAMILMGFLFSPCVSASNLKCGDGLVLVYEVSGVDAVDGGKNVTTVSYSLGSKLTMIQRSGALDIIDYEGLRLFRYREDEGSCETFYLVDSSLDNGRGGPKITEREVVTAKARLLGGHTVEIVDTAALHSGGAVWKRVVWGGETGLFRTAGKVSVEMYGQLFETETEECLVSGTAEGVDELLCLAGMREPVFNTNPLLRRLDIGGGVLLLQGIPLEITSGGGYILRLKEIGSAPQLSLQDVLPQICK